MSVGTAENQQDSNYQSNILNKNRKKKCANESWVQSATEITQVDNCLAEEFCGTKTNSLTLSSSSTSLNNFVTSETVELDASVKRKTRNSPSPEKSKCNSLLISRIPETSPIKSDILKEVFNTSLENNDLNCKKPVNSKKQKRNIHKEQSVEGSMNKNLTESFEILSKNSSSSQHEQPLDNEFTAKNVLVENTDTEKEEKLNEVIKKDIGVSTVQGETELQATQGPIRSSTFILSEPGVSSEASIMPVSAPRRNSTFILDNSCDNSPKARSLRFSTARGGNSPKARSLRLSTARDSTLKKPSMKTTKMGSIFKKSSVTKKMPDFKKIHQQLFHNMESLSEHKKRVQNRALGLLQSPIVPRCALVSPRQANSMNVAKSPYSQAQNIRVKTLKPNSPRVEMRSLTMASPLAVQLPSSVPAHTPAKPTAPLEASSVTRFGFRKVVRKEEATKIIGRRLPDVTLEKKKEYERNLIKGVRMNKRFMLQMQMRRTGENSDK